MTKKRVKRSLTKNNRGAEGQRRAGFFRVTYRRGGRRGRRAFKGAQGWMGVRGGLE